MDKPNPKVGETWLDGRGKEWGPLENANDRGCYHEEWTLYAGGRAWRSDGTFDYGSAPDKSDLIKRKEDSVDKPKLGETWIDRSGKEWGPLEHSDNAWACHYPLMFGGLHWRPDGQFSHHVEEHRSDLVKRKEDSVDKPNPRVGETWIDRSGKEHGPLRGSNESLPHEEFCLTCGALSWRTNGTYCPSGSESTMDLIERKEDGVDKPKVGERWWTRSGGVTGKLVDGDERDFPLMDPGTEETYTDVGLTFYDEVNNLDLVAKYEGPDFPGVQFRLELGKRYVSRGGYISNPISEQKDEGPYVFSDTIYTYTSHGRTHDGETNDEDLIREFRGEKDA